MLVRNFKYVDYNGNEREESWAFNMSKADVIKWLTTSGDYTLDKVLERLANERNGKKIMEIFDDLIDLSVGQVTLDGRGFEKTEALRKDFRSTPAYDELFSEVVTDAKKAADFVNAIIPKQLADDVAKIVAENPDGVPDTMKDYVDTTATITNIDEHK